MAERCDEIAEQVTELKHHMLTKGDIPTIAQATADIVKDQALAQVGRSTLRTLWFIMIAAASVLTGWLAAHGYISPPQNGGPPQ